MNKQEYLNALNKELKKLPKEEKQNAMQYYMEYFDDAGPEQEQKVMIELGHPKDVANTLLSDYAIKRMNMPAPVTTKKNLSALKWVIIALVASPIALPLAFCLILLVLLVAATAFLLMAFCVAASVVGAACGVVACASAIYLLFIHDPATFFVFSGAGLLSIAFSILLGMSGVGLGRLTVRLIRKFVTFVVERRQKKDEKKRQKNETDD